MANKETFDAVLKRLGKQKATEIAEYLRNGGVSDAAICSRYGVTPWFLHSYKMALGFLPDPRNDQIISDMNAGMSDGEISVKYGLEPSRISQIRSHHRDINTNSKELF